MAISHLVMAAMLVMRPGPFEYLISVTLEATYEIWLELAQLFLFLFYFIYTMFKEGSTFSCKAILPCGPLYIKYNIQYNRKTSKKQTVHAYTQIYQLGSGTT